MVYPNFLNLIQIAKIKVTHNNNSKIVSKMLLINKIITLLRKQFITGT